jgi:hypothetical protein
LKLLKWDEKGVADNKEGVLIASVYLSGGNIPFSAE